METLVVKRFLNWKMATQPYIRYKQSLGIMELAKLGIIFGRIHIGIRTILIHQTKDDNNNIFFYNGRLLMGLDKR